MTIWLLFHYFRLHSWTFKSNVSTFRGRLHSLQLLSWRGRHFSSLLVEKKPLGNIFSHSSLIPCARGRGRSGKAALLLRTGEKLFPGLPLCKRSAYFHSLAHVLPVFNNLSNKEQRSPWLNCGWNVSWYFKCYCGRLLS